MNATQFSRRRLLQSAPALAVAGLMPARLLQAASPVSGDLVLYTSQPERDANATIAAFNQVHPGVRVEVFRSGTTEVMNRLRTEFAAGAPRADVLLIADAVSMEALKAEGRLQAMRHLNTVEIPSRYFDLERTYMGTKVISSGIVVNARSPFKPQSLKDLADPRLKGQVLMPSPLYSGAAAISIGTWSRHADLGWGFVEQLRANDVTAVRGNGAVLQAVASGEKMAGVLVDFMAFNARSRGSPVEFVVPTEGMTFVTEPTAILNTARNLPAAQAFTAFLVSPEGQRFAASQGYYPLLRGVAAPEGYPAIESLRFMELDMPALLAGSESDRQRFASIFGG